MEQSFEVIHKEYQALAYSIADSYRNRGVYMEDLRQESLIGLYKAYQHYNPERETKFSTYAVFWIKKQVIAAIQKEVSNASRTEELTESHIRVLQEPELRSEPETKLKLPDGMPEIEINIIRLSYERSCSLNEIARMLNTTVERVKQHKQKALRRLRNQNSST